MPFAIIPFIIQVAATYLINRALAPDGPRLKELGAAGGDYGVPMPRAYGAKVRAPGIFIAQDDIKEKKHKTGGILNSPLFGIAGVLGAFSQTYYTYSDTFALMLADRTDDDPIEGIDKVWANGKLIFKGGTVTDEEYGTDGKLVWRKYKKNKYFKSLTLYTGHTEQPLDPILEDKVDEESAYPFTAYIVVEKLQLADFGNSVPACEILFSVKAGQTLAEVAEQISAASGIDVIRDISTTALTSNVVRGYLVNEESTCFDALKPLLPVFGVDAAEVAGQIRFYRRDQTMRSTITVDDMGAYVYGESPPDRFSFKRSPDVGLPQETAITFVDPARDYQPNTAASARSEGNAKSNVTLTLPLVLTADEGASAAALLHWDTWLGRTTLAFTLTDSWIGMAVGLAYGIPVADQVVPYRITRKTRGANGIIEVEAISDESVTYSASVKGDSGVAPEDPSTEFDEPRLIFMDMSIIDDEHDDYGFYLVVGGGSGNALIQASDDGVTYEDIADLPESAVAGDVTGTLAAGPTDGLDDTLDTTTVLTVVLLTEDMELESTTDAQLDLGKNLSFVGKDGLGEYIQFKTATLVSGSTWQLTNLRRGRRGTDFAIDTHASGEEFALVDGPGVYRITQPIAEWGNEYSFRAFAMNQDENEDVVDVVTFTNTGEGKRPYSPINVEGTWDGSNNLTATFEDRSRLNAGGLGVDDNYEFDVEITNASPVRTIVVTAETFNYSAADQTTDGLTPGTIVEGRVRQTSDVNDGRWREFTLYGPAALLFDSTLASFDSGTVTWDVG